jgi:pyruvate kinase
MFKLENIMEDTDYEKAIRTRIIGTVGPSCHDKDKILNLMDAGMNIFRV